jgi:hypothetical protein
LALTPFAVDQFGGLDLASDPTQVGFGAVDMLNIDFKPRGGIRTRPGLTTFTAFNQGTPASNNWQFIWESHNGKILAYAGGTTYVIDPSAGTSVTSASMTPSGSYANYGGKVEHANGTTFIARSGGSVPNVYNGTVLGTASYVGTQPTGDGVAFTALSGRLANWGVSGNPFRVLFSDAGDPYTFGANNFVDVVTNDFTGLRGRFGCMWGGSLHLLTQRYMHVFPSSGETTDGTGSPIFNWYPVETPFQDAYVSHMLPATDGVYVMTTKGLYRFTGSSFALVSDGVVPLVQGDTTFGGTPQLYLCGDSDAHRASTVNDQLYFPASTTGTTGPPDYMLVWDLRTRSWLLWSIAYTSMGFATGQRRPRLLVSLRTATSPNPITYLDPTATTDNGSTVSCRYTSGAYDAALPGQVKVAQETKLVGTGTVNLQMATTGGNLSTAGVFDSAGSVALGTSPAVGEGWRMTDFEGVMFQHKLTWTGAASIDRLVHYLSYVRDAGVE